jgi:hypothetical protein
MVSVVNLTVIKPMRAGLKRLSIIEITATFSVVSTGLPGMTVQIMVRPDHFLIICQDFARRSVLFGVKLVVSHRTCDIELDII